MLEERELIRHLRVPDPARADLLAIALTVGSRYLSRNLLLGVFQEDLPVLKGAGIVEDWIEDGIKRGEALGLARGRAEGRVEQARHLLLCLLKERFGDLPDHVEERVNNADAESCEATSRKLIHAESLADLDL